MAHQLLAVCPQAEGDARVSSARRPQRGARADDMRTSCAACMYVCVHVWSSCASPAHATPRMHCSVALPTPVGHVRAWGCRVGHPAASSAPGVHLLTTSGHRAACSQSVIMHTGTAYIPLPLTLPGGTCCPPAHAGPRQRGAAAAGQRRGRDGGRGAGAEAAGRLPGPGGNRGSQGRGERGAARRAAEGGGSGGGGGADAVQRRRGGRGRERRPQAEKGQGV